MRDMEKGREEQRRAKVSCLDNVGDFVLGTFYTLSHLILPITLWGDA